MRDLRGLLVLAAALALGACATATVVPVGDTRAAIDPSQVHIYAQPPAHYEVVAILSGNAGIEGTGQDAVDDVMKKLKDQAARLGANGILLGKIGQQYHGSFGGSSYLGWGNSIGSSTASYSKTIDAQAIYVAAGTGAVAYRDEGAQHGAWPLALPSFDITANCHAVGGNVNACVAAEQSARAWLASHTTTVQIAGDCSAFAPQSYTMIEACVRQREGAR